MPGASGEIGDNRVYISMVLHYYPSDLASNYVELSYTCSCALLPGYITDGGKRIALMRFLPDERRAEGAIPAANIPASVFQDDERADLDGCQALLDASGAPRKAWQDVLAELNSNSARCAPYHIPCMPWEQAAAGELGRMPTFLKCVHLWSSYMYQALTTASSGNDNQGCALNRHDQTPVLVRFSAAVQHLHVVTMQAHEYQLLRDASHAYTGTARRCGTLSCHMTRRQWRLFWQRTPIRGCRCSAWWIRHLWPSWAATWHSSWLATASCMCVASQACPVGFHGS